MWPRPDSLNLSSPMVTATSSTASSLAVPPGLFLRNCRATAQSMPPPAVTARPVKAWRRSHVSCQISSSTAAPSLRHPAAHARRPAASASKSATAPRIPVDRSEGEAVNEVPNAPLPAKHGELHAERDQLQVDRDSHEVHVLDRRSEGHFPRLGGAAGLDPGELFFVGRRRAVDGRDLGAHQFAGPRTTARSPVSPGWYLSAASCSLHAPAATQSATSSSVG